jgi:hypothetical protein
MHSIYNNIVIIFVKPIIVKCINKRAANVLTRECCLVVYNLSVATWVGIMVNAVLAPDYETSLIPSLLICLVLKAI